MNSQKTLVSKTTSSNFYKTRYTNKTRNSTSTSFFSFSVSRFGFEEKNKRALSSQNSFRRVTPHKIRISILKKKEDLNHAHRSFLREKYKEQRKLTPDKSFKPKSFSIDEERYKSPLNISQKLSLRIAESYLHNSSNLSEFVNNFKKTTLCKSLLEDHKKSYVLLKENKENDMDKVYNFKFRIKEKYFLLNNHIIPVTDTYILDLQSKARKENDKLQNLIIEKDKLIHEIDKINKKIEFTKSRIMKDIKIRNLLICVKEKNLYLPSSFSPENEIVKHEQQIFHTPVSTPKKIQKIKKFSFGLGNFKSLFKDKKGKRCSTIPQQLKFSFLDDTYAKYKRANYRIFADPEEFMLSFQLITDQILIYTKQYSDKLLEIHELKKERDQMKAELLVFKENFKKEEKIANEKISFLTGQIKKNNKAIQEIKNSYGAKYFKKLDKMLLKSYDIIENLKSIKGLVNLKSEELIAIFSQESKLLSLQTEKKYAFIRVLLIHIEFGILKLLNIIKKYKSIPRLKKTLFFISKSVEMKRKVKNAAKVRKIMEKRKKKVLENIVKQKDKIYVLPLKKVNTPIYLLNKKKEVKKEETEQSSINYDDLLKYEEHED